jgi:hypothetical protein
MINAIDVAFVGAFIITIPVLITGWSQCRVGLYNIN